MAPQNSHSICTTRETSTAHGDNLVALCSPTPDSAQSLPLSTRLALHTRWHAVLEWQTVSPPRYLLLLNSTHLHQHWLACTPLSLLARVPDD